ncbi:MAG: hypothetical protein QOF57_396 [Frankiaceae bacterium]|nr:hypothetical protein [Frankiaceae bacterium]
MADEPTPPRESRARIEHREAAVTDVPVQRDAEARLGALSPEKRALLEKRLLARAATTKPGPPPITRRTTDGPARLSPVQELLWLVTELNPEESFVYNSSGVTRLRGQLDADALSRSLSLIVRRHEALRTTFRSVAGVPVQDVHAVDGVHLERVDLGDLEEAERDRALAELIRREVRWPFVLSEPLLFRPTLVRLACDEHVLVTVAHHIVWDGWSKGVFFRELATAYAAFTDGAEPTLPDVPIGYTDFAEWQRAWLESGEQDRQLDYWRRQLAGVPPVHTLPTDRPRPAVQSFRGDRTSHWLSAELTAAIHDLARANGVTLFMALLAGLDALLHRYSGQSDVVIGTPIAGRSRVELENIIGYFTNTVALRTYVGDDPTFAEVLTRVRSTSLDAYANQDVSFKQVVQEVAPARDLSHSPLFQVLFVLQNAASERMELPGITLERIPNRPEIAKFDLTFGMGEHDGRLHVSVEYAEDLFDLSTVQRLLQHYERVLAGAVADPTRPVSQLELLTEAERTQQLVEWNATAADIPDRRVHDRISDLALAEPQAPAIDAPDATLTRGELDARARGIAAALGERGVGVGDIVAVVAPRSAAFTVAVLGALRAGAAYVPVDPDYPADRVAFMARDAGVKAVLTTDALHARLEGALPDGVPFLDIDAVPDADAGTTFAAVGPGDLAYVMYTSGSTGVPKGVMVTHGNLAAHVVASTSDYDLTPADRVLQFASPSFDISVEEIYCTLAAGGTLVVRPDDVAIAGDEWLRWLTATRVTVMDLPTAYWHEWVRELRLRGAQTPPGLRLVIVGGEKALPAAYAEWRALVGDRVRWVNTYGPTEATVVATSYWPRPERAADDAHEIPIGRPVANVRTYVLDQHRGPVPVGCTGELYIGGAGVAAGYLHNPGLTAERFVDSPFAAGERLYRTGDRARQLADGSLVFAGRVDHQVKVRGYRVEPGEIELVLTAHPSVAEGIVLPRTDAGGTVMLCAYAVVADGVAVDADDVRAHLRAHLPSYMVPASLHLLEALPLNANGKVDVAALPDPESAPREVVAPRSETEKVLHEIWSEVLGHAVPSVHDDFFDVGGHSLLAVRLFSIVHTRLGKRLPLAAVIAHPTIAELAALIDADERSTDGYVSLVPMQPRGTRPPVFVVHEITGDVIGYRQIASALGPDQPVYGLLSPVLNGTVGVRHRIEDIAASYIAEVRDFHPSGPYRLMGSCFGGVVAYEMARQLVAQGHAVDFVGLINAVPFGYVNPAAVEPRRAPRSAADVRARLHSLTVKGRRRLHRRLWWRMAARYVLAGEPLPAELSEPITLHHVASYAHVTRPYPGRVVNLVTDTAPLSPHDRRLLWDDLTGGVERIELVGPDYVRPHFVTSPGAVEGGRRFKRVLDELEGARS